MYTWDFATLTIIWKKATTWKDHMSVFEVEIILTFKLPWYNPYVLTFISFIIHNWQTAEKTIVLLTSSFYGFVVSVSSAFLWNYFTAMHIIHIHFQYRDTICVSWRSFSEPGLFINSLQFFRVRYCETIFLICQKYTLISSWNANVNEFWRTVSKFE